MSPESSTRSVSSVPEVVAELDAHLQGLFRHLADARKALGVLQDGPEGEWARGESRDFAALRLDDLNVFNIKRDLWRGAIQRLARAAEAHIVSPAGIPVTIPCDAAEAHFGIDSETARHHHFEVWSRSSGHQNDEERAAAMVRALGLDALTCAAIWDYLLVTYGTRAHLQAAERTVCEQFANTFVMRWQRGKRVAMPPVWRKGRLVLSLTVTIERNYYGTPSLSYGSAEYVCSAMKTLHLALRLVGADCTADALGLIPLVGRDTQVYSRNRIVCGALAVVTFQTRFEIELPEDVGLSLLAAVGPTVTGLMNRAAA